MCDGILADVQGVGEEVQLPLVHLKLLPPGLLLPCHNSDMRHWHGYIQTQVWHMVLKSELSWTIGIVVCDPICHWIRA